MRVTEVKTTCDFCGKSIPERTGFLGRKADACTDCADKLLAWYLSTHVIMRHCDACSRRGYTLEWDPDYRSDPIEGMKLAPQIRVPCKVCRIPPPEK